MTFAIARSVNDALAALAAGAVPIAGGSDLVVAARNGKAPLPESLVAIDRLSELSRIETLDGGGVRIGALTTHAQLMIHPIVVESFTALADASALVGSPATRHVGTLGGNIMNASPAMDTGAPLIVFDAVAELRSTYDSRDVPVDELWVGPGMTSARADELCVAVRLSPRPVAPTRSGSAYVRLEYRRAMEIAVVGAGASIELADDDSTVALRVALSAVAPTIVAVDCAPFAGRLVNESMLSAIAAAAADRSSPISDVRASDRYRRHCVGVMARRAVEAAARRARGDSIAVPVNRALGIGAVS
jgi:CO/xanthine dehydrogenase FAD-binding subunit